MHERLLQFIWRNQYFNSRDCHTQEGEPLHIFFPGLFNTGQGPDFLDAQIAIGGQRWYGSIELHIRASDWERHAHGSDPHYQNVILHVVLENDRPIDHPMPVFVLGDRISKVLLDRYTLLMQTTGFIPCNQRASAPGARVWTGWKERLLVQRMERQADRIEGYLRQNGQDWDETCWWLIAAGFGTNINSAGMLAIAQSLRRRLMARFSHRPDQIQALLLGQAGLLSGDLPIAGLLAERRAPADKERNGGKSSTGGVVGRLRASRKPDAAFSNWLRSHLWREYCFLRDKLGLHPIPAALLFHRMRPANAPVMRLLQLAELIACRSSWMADIKDAKTLAGLRGLIEPGKSGGTQSTDKWIDEGSQKHMNDAVVGMRSVARRSDTAALVYQVPRPGAGMKDSLLINALLPLLYAYGRHYRIKEIRDRVLTWMTEIPAEKNAQIAGWAQLGVTSSNAADTQALLELRKYYCQNRRCLECQVGQALLGEPAGNQAETSAGFQ